MSYQNRRRIVTYCNEYYTKLIEAYTHMHMKRKTDIGREAIVSFFKNMPESDKQNLLDYHLKQNLSEHFKHGEK